MCSSDSGTMYAIVLVMLAAMSTCQGAPSFRPKSDWPEMRDDGEEAPAILTSNCDPVTGRCREWQPLGDMRLGEYDVMQDAAEFNREPIHTRGVDQMKRESWRDPVYGRLAKKDVFASRGWGAGGMPFSVLYMSPRANHLASGTAKAHKSSDITRKSEDSSSSPLPVASAQHQQPQPQQQQSNYRVSLRNGVHGPQPRRNYSIIPQLFISYGWGPSGK